MERSRPIGIRFEQDFLDDIESELEYGDSRAQRIRKYTIIGYYLVNQLDEYGTWHELPENVEEKQVPVKHAITQLVSDAESYRTEQERD